MQVPDYTTMPHKASPLETLLRFELQALSVEQETLSHRFTWLREEPRPEQAHNDFLARVARLKWRTSRLERVLDEMSALGSGCEDWNQPGFPINIA